ncbi:hypothetical protein ACFSTI_17885 [Rhizorhabdus histidinilytica]
MSVRTVIILLALPLFLFLAGINSLLLYRQETYHMEAGLRGEALAAAVTVAESHDRPTIPSPSWARPAGGRPCAMLRTRYPGSSRSISAGRAGRS